MNDMPVLFAPDQAAQRLGNDQELLKHLVQIFLEESPNYEGALTEAINHQDNEQLKQAAHKIKGASSTIGATGLSEAAKDLETLCKQHGQDLPLIAMVHVDAVSRLFQQTIDALTLWLNQFRA